MFLTLEDPRAKIQGSRDPLGVQPVWSRFGRHVVTNLTTVTTAVRGFTTLLLGRYYGERFVAAGDVQEHEVLSVFLRMEQIAGYARLIGEGEDPESPGLQDLAAQVENADEEEQEGRPHEQGVDAEDEAALRRNVILGVDHRRAR